MSMIDIVDDLVGEDDAKVIDNKVNSRLKQLSQKSESDPEDLDVDNMDKPESPVKISLQ